MKYKGMLPYLLVVIVSFYVLPFIINNTGMAMLIMLIIFPIISFVCSLLYSYKQEFQLLFSVFTAVLFIPCIFLFYNDSAMIYSLIYGGISFIGLMIGYLLKQLKLR